jgi:DNA repair protein RecO (recombination protein O)
MALYNTESINIRSRNTGEADKIITLFSKRYGKIQAIAKGARRPTSKFGGRLELFSYNHIQLATARTLDIISQCETIESFYKLREDKEKLNAGFYMVKLIDIITEDRQRNDELFALLLEALYSLQATSDAAKLSRAFEIKLCDIEGFLPSDEMLERKYKRLPWIVSELKGDMNELPKGLTEKDLDVSGRVFREIISEHTGRDIRKVKAML